MAKRKSITGRERRRKSSAAVLLSPRQQTTQVSRLITDTTLDRDTQSPRSIEPSRTSRSLHGSSSALQAGKKRKRTTPEDIHADNVVLSTRKFAALKPRVKYIPQRVIKSRWRVLPELVQDKVKEIFRSLERPVITSHRDEGRRAEAQTAVTSVTRTLGRRLPRMPFPPDTKEIHFSYEALLDSNRGLEAQLDPAIHSVALYQGEIEREQHLLAEEKRNLEALETNARTEESLYRRQASKRHNLLRSESVFKEANGRDATGFVENVPAMTSGLDQQHLDAKLEPLVMQLHNHLGSMQSNADETKGISEALGRAKATLDDLLYCHLDRQHYTVVASA